MLKRQIKITFRVNAKEQRSLSKQAKKSGFSQEAFIRTLINGYVPKELPPPDYFSMMKELHAIGGNLNQIAAKANATGHIDRTLFQYEANRLRKAVQDIIEAVTAPERRNDDGDHCHMGRDRPP